MKKIDFYILTLILLIGLIARLYKINRPLADWHSWRQADTAAVARNFVKEGYNPFLPKYDDMSTQANGLDNPNRYRFVEFPVYNSLVAAVWSISGVNVTSARLITVVITLASTALLYILVLRFSGTLVATLSAFFFASIPYNVFYSSTILPGPTMVFCLLALYLSFIKWLDARNKLPWMLLSIVFANLAILTWPIALVFLLPVVYLALDKYGISAVKRFDLWLFAALSLVPFAAWRLWILRHPEGIPDYAFLLNGDHIRFKGAFFRWLIVERMGKLILTVTGFSLFILGIVKKPEKERFFYYSLLASTILYFSIFASGNVRHDYYQVPFIPTTVIFMALGTQMLLRPSAGFSRLLGPAVALSSIAFMLIFGAYEVRGYYWINRPQIVEAGKAVDRLLPKDATVIAPYNGDAAFLYQTNRHGYPITDRPLEKFIEQGTKYLVSVDVADAGIQNLAKHCKVIDQAKNYIIVEMFADCIGKQ